MPASPVRRLGLSWPLLVGLGTLLIVTGSAAAVALLRDPDSYWHVAAGHRILAERAIPTTDSFSHSMPGAPWTAHEWLSELILTGAHEAGGWSGLVILTAAALALTLALLTRYYLDHQSPALALVLTLGAVALLMPPLLARPHVLTWPIMALWTVTLLRAGEARRAPAWGWAGLVTLWANLHGSFPFALVLGVGLAADAVLGLPRDERRAAASRWGLFLGLAVAASLLTPQGAYGWVYLVEVVRMDVATRVIGEWQSPDFHFLQPIEIVMLQLLGLGLLGMIRLPIVRIAIVLGLFHMALSHQRHVSLVGIIVPALLAAPLARRRAPTAVTAPAPPTPPAADVGRLTALARALVAPAHPLAVVLALALGGVGATAISRANPPAPEEDRPLRAALADALAAGARGPVLNSYGFGGFLVYHRVPVFIDGRADMYGDAFLQSLRDALGLKEGRCLTELLAKYKIGWTMLYTGTPAIALLDTLPEWRRVHADDTVVVHVRAVPEPAR